MKLVSWNVNGIRACVRRGFLDYVQAESPDVLCIQETKSTVEQLPKAISDLKGYQSTWFSAKRPGYSGVAVLMKQQPVAITHGMGIDRFDQEGRVIQVDFEAFTLFSVYFPNGQASSDRLNYKLDFYEAFFDHCDRLRQLKKSLIICGDYNTAHQAIDLANPKANKNYSGFLPVERAWMDKIIARGYVDTFRRFDPSPGQYSWWTYRFGARKKNIGWRIDYCLVSSDIVPRLKDAFIQPSVMGSDHCPVGICLSH